MQTCQKMKTGNGDSSCIDVDHINLESERNYKNKYVSIGVQTSPLVPYRLRFWPKGSSNVKCNPDESGCSKLQLKCCCHTFSRLCLSQIGLTIMLVFWALLGAAAFFYTEGKSVNIKIRHKIDYFQGWLLKGGSKCEPVQMLFHTGINFFCSRKADHSVLF